MPDVYDELSAWLKSRVWWQQEAAVRILTNGSLSDRDVNELVAASKTDEGRRQGNSRQFPGLVRATAGAGDLRVELLGPVEGIENLAPRRPLVLGTGKLTVVFGGNGTGKSGYVRILKSLSGKPVSSPLRTNVFAKSPAHRKCGIAFRVGNQRTETEWHVGDPIEALRVIDIFDAEAGRLYISKENEASYTPPAVSLLEQLASTCDRVRKKLTEEIDALRSALPLLPPEYTNTAAGKAYRALQADHDDKKIDSLFNWGPEHSKALEAEEERLRAVDPADVARQKRARASQLDAILARLSGAYESVAPEQCKEIARIRKAATDAREAATGGARAMNSSGDLAGVGGSTWRALWEAARKYSSAEAYKGKSFPYVDDGAKCVLCQQVLTSETQKRFRTFEEFVSGELEFAAKQAERVRDERLEALPVCLDQPSLATACVAGGISPDTWVPELTDAWAKLNAVTVALRAGGDWEQASAGAVGTLERFKDFRRLSDQLKAEAKQHEADSASFDRPAATIRRVELLSRKWTSQQIASVRLEVCRLSKVAGLKEVLNAASSAAFSRKASEVAEALITAEYVSRFNDELAELGAARLRVELVKTRASHGKIMHRVALKGAAQAIGVADVLSEGEKRIVELAAFLADVTGKPGTAPFVFDDPISSLDQEFEERTAKRLGALSEDRQVLVFTHRLSLLGLLSKASDEHIHIRHEPWGAGEPGELALFAKRPEKALNDLKNGRVARAAKILESAGAEEYYALAKGICSDIRILTERMVELVLLGGVIERHSREVKTKGLLKGLTRIEPSDCDFIDTIMTKYSKYEHSQSLEAPSDLPRPDEFRVDIEALVGWHAQFTARAPQEHLQRGEKLPGQISAVKAL